MNFRYLTALSVFFATCGMPQASYTQNSAPFQGFHIGVLGDWAWVKGSVFLPANPLKTEGNGGGLGFTLGYRTHINNFTIGLEIATAFKNISTPIKLVVPGAAKIELGVHLKSQSEIGLQLGHAIDRWFPFVYTGYAVNTAEITINNMVGGGKGRSSHFLLGCGIEYLLTEKLIVSAEYLHHFSSPLSIEDNNYNVLKIEGTSFTNNTIRAKILFQF